MFIRNPTFLNSRESCDCFSYKPLLVTLFINDFIRLFIDMGLYVFTSFLKQIANRNVTCMLIKQRYLILRTLEWNKIQVQTIWFWVFWIKKKMLKFCVNGKAQPFLFKSRSVLWIFTKKVFKINVMGWFIKNMKN